MFHVKHIWRLLLSNEYSILAICLMEIKFMGILFSKYQGAGNDFVLINDSDCLFPDKNVELISKICDRRFGVGADGLILLRPSLEKDFTMMYFNSDGYEGTMCGNGGRCVVAFAKDCGCISKNINISFDAIDGVHNAEILPSGDILLKMIDVDSVVDKLGGYLVETGSTHHVEYATSIDDVDLLRDAGIIRTHREYSPLGCNVNYVEDLGGGSLAIRTYERGVEAETLACGTGAVAAAIVHHHCGHVFFKYHIKAKGGNLFVSFVYTDKGYTNIYLEGPAKFVFKGEY